MSLTSKKRIGNLGEELTSIFLIKKGHMIIDRNWEKHNIGEIDIISKKDEILYFVEVKTTENSSNRYSPLEHLDSRKLKKFQRIVNHYLIQKNLIDSDYKISASFVYINPDTKKAKINFIEDFY
jgi:putative endonuclease